MAATRYVALLRGINVGGKNKVVMADLREAFTDAGFEGVRTYIASGNVLFRTERPAMMLENEIEAALKERFGIPLVVVVRTHRQLRTIVNQAPADFVALHGTHHRDAVFLKSPLTSAKAMRVVQLRAGVDKAWAGTGVVYFARLSAERQRSLMSKIVGTPEYQLMTIRSWSTTTKLLALLDDI
ncbi:MAG TPA: DUF1697 domain-containing protein [Acidimicrobiales bacterium]|nr:DUF1697 domain-containing protein [Acidimicrobiales bacterium]